MLCGLLTINDMGINDIESPINRGIPQNGWFKREKPIDTNDLAVSTFRGLRAKIGGQMPADVLIYLLPNRNRFLRSSKR